MELKDWITALVGLLGAGFGGWATLRAVAWQLRDQARSHQQTIAAMVTAHSETISNEREMLEKTLSHQTKLLADTFQQQMQLQVSEFRRANQIVMLDAAQNFMITNRSRIFDAVGKNAASILPRFNDGACDYIQSSAQGLEQLINDYLRDYACLLDTYRQHANLHASLMLDLKVQSDLFQALRSFQDYFDWVSKGDLPLTLEEINKRWRDFTTCSNELFAWTQRVIDTCVAHKTELLELRA